MDQYFSKTLSFSINYHSMLFLETAHSLSNGMHAEVRASGMHLGIEINAAVGLFLEKEFSFVSLFITVVSFVCIIISLQICQIISVKLQIQFQQLFP